MSDVTPKTLREQAKKWRMSSLGPEAKLPRILDAAADAWERERQRFADSGERYGALLRQLDAIKKALRRALEIHETVDYLPDGVVNKWAEEAHAALAGEEKP